MKQIPFRFEGHVRIWFLKMAGNCGSFVHHGFIVTGDGAFGGRDIVMMMEMVEEPAR